MNLMMEDRDELFALKETANNIHVIINPVAQNKGSMKIWNLFEKELTANEVDYEAHFTHYAGHAKELTADILNKTNVDTLIIAVGGDGTLHEVIDGAYGYRHAIVSCIPAGSGNDFSRGIQHTVKPIHAINRLLKQHRDRSDQRLLDVGEYEIGDTKAHFINSLGMGIDAETTAAVNGSSWKKWFNLFKIGKLIYIYFFAEKLFTYKRADMDITLDGVTVSYKKVWLAVVANQPYFGGGIKFSPYALPDDCIFNVMVVHNISRIKLLYVFFTVVWGGHLTCKNVESHMAKEVHMRASHTVRVQADGENIGDSEVSLRLSPAKIRILES